MTRQTKMYTPNQLKDMNAKISANADRLISLGYKKWKKTRRAMKQDWKPQEQQVREMEDRLLDAPQEAGHHPS